MVNFEMIMRGTQEKQLQVLNEISNYRWYAKCGEALGCAGNESMAFFPLIRPITFWDISIIDGAADDFTEKVLGPWNSELPFKIPSFLYAVIKHLKPFRGKGKKYDRKIGWEEGSNVAVHVIGEKMDTNHEHITGKCPACGKDTKVVFG